MSRHVIESNERREVVVGWDPPQDTFYAQVFTQPESLYEECTWWIGYETQEVVTLEELLLALKGEGITLPSDVLQRLTADKAEPWEPGPLQRQLGFLGKEGA